MKALLLHVLLLVASMGLVGTRDLRWSWYVFSIAAWVTTGAVAAAAMAAGMTGLASAAISAYGLTVIALIVNALSGFRALTITLGLPIVVFLILIGVT